MRNRRHEGVPLIVLMKNAYPQVRKYLVYALVIALTMSSALPNPAYRAAVLSALGVTLLFLLFDIYNELNTRLSGIEECVKSPAPPQFPDFRAAEEEIYQTIEASLVEAQKVTLDLLTISGSYSWRFVEDAVRRLLDRFDRTRTIEINMGLIHPDHFDRWSLPNWKRKAEVSLADMEAFKVRYGHEIAEGKIVLKQFLFDNIPHWHGILINDNTLYLGRTQWDDLQDHPHRSPELLVGQVEYRRFHKTDRFGGKERIERFKNWTHRYTLRHQEIQQGGRGVASPGTSQ